MTLYEVKPDFLVRAPGRVNFLGSHIDCSGFPVLATALEHDIVVCCALSGDDTITINNTNGEEFPTQTITTDPAQPFKDKGHFNNYFLCGYKAMLSEDSPVALDGGTPPKGMNILIDSL